MVRGVISSLKSACLVSRQGSEKKIADVLGSVGVRRLRYQLGEGIEEEQEDFAAEVAAQMK